MNMNERMQKKLFKKLLTNAKMKMKRQNQNRSTLIKCLVELTEVFEVYDDENKIYVKEDFVNMSTEKLHKLFVSMMAELETLIK